MLNSQCNLLTGAVPAACSGATVELTTTQILDLVEIQAAMKEGRVIFQGQKVRTLNHLKKLHSDSLKAKQKRCLNF